MECTRVGISTPATVSQSHDVADWIPVFHRWIRESKVPGLLIDVADYTHMPQGPGVLLMAFEGYYAMEFLEGQPALAYRTRGGAGIADTESAVRQAVESLIQAGRVAEADPEVGGAVGFPADEFLFYANDRLACDPKDDAAVEAFGAVVATVAAEVFGGASVQRVDGSAFRVVPDSEVSFATLA